MSEKGSFELAPDGWVQLTPIGEFFHKGAEVTQVLDRPAFDAMAAAFDEAAKAENFPGVLVDFDHFSMDTDKPSEAAGWITALDARGDGLWAQVRWSDSGLAAVTGGRFRLVSPVFPAPDQCESLGEGRIRPRRLLSVALTNEPNIKGAKPIANRKPGEPKGKDAAAGAQRYRWVLGEIKEGSKHCAVCEARAGQVKTAAEWAAMKAPFCHCHCTLEPVDDEDTANRWTDAARAARKNFPGWSDAARAASAAARRAKAGGGDADPGEADGFAAAFIRQYEGFEGAAYPDPATGGEPWTVGFGSTRGLDGKPVKPGDRVTREQAVELLLRDMKKESSGLSSAVPWGKLNARQQAALMSWAYNIGGRAAASSTLAKRLAAGEDPSVVIREELPRWNKAAGRVMRGLTARRLAEVAMAEGGALGNRWSDAARAARKNFPGWSDAARAAAAAARAAKRAELKAKLADGTASPADRLAASLDAPFEDAEKALPAGYEGPVMGSGGRAPEETVDDIYADGLPDLRDVVGAGPRSGNKYVDAVTAGIGTATLLGGMAVPRPSGRAGLSAIQKSIARKQARVEAVARSRARAYYQNTPTSEQSAPVRTPRSAVAVGKVCGYLKEGVNASRALITSFDLSALLRQGGILSFANPKLVPGAMASMFKALLSEASAERLDAQLRTRPNAALYRQGGLYLSDGPSGSMTAREEAYCSELAKMIPGVGASERAFSACLNRLRADCFDTMVESLCCGHTPTTAELESISNYINVATGRGSLGSFEKHAGALSTVFFAPKLAASRFEYLFGQPLTGGTVASRKLIAEQYARYLAGVGTVYALSLMAGAEVGDDTNSSDAGKIRVGENTRIDILSGLAQSLVFVSRMACGLYATTTGKEYQTDKMDAKVTRLDVETRFLRTKLSPLFGANVDRLAGKDVVGQPVSPEDALLDLVVPLVARDVAEVYREHRVPTATAEALLSLFGAGVAVYRNNRSKARRPEGKPSTGLDVAVDRLTGARPGVLEEEALRAVKVEKKVRRRGPAPRGKSVRRHAGGSPEEKEMEEITMLKKSRRGGKKEKARAGGALLVTNRWTDAARAARTHFHGWSDSARAAAAAARARKRAEAGGTYPDGRPVISDVIGAFDGNDTDPSKTYLDSADGVEARQARYAESFRRWWHGVERTSGNIAAFNAFVASFGGAAAGGMGAYRQATGMSPSAGASQAFGRAGRYVSGKEPVYDEAGSLTGFAGVGRRPYVRGDNAPLRQPYRRAGSLSADEGTAVVTDPATGRAVGRVRYDSPVSGDFFRGMRGMGPDPFNSPVTKADFAFQASYSKYLDELNAGRDAEQAALGRDPMGFALEGGTGDAEADEVLGLYERVKGIVPRTAEEVDAYGDVLEGLRAYGEMYEADRAERDPGLLERIGAKLDELEKGSSGAHAEPYGGAREAADDYDAVPYADGAAGFAHPEEAAAAARALGVLHGSYGAGPEARDSIPPELLEDYVRGLEEGGKGYDYGVVTPKDRSAVLRRARAFAEGRLGDFNEDYEADHIDDKYNAKKFDDAAAWATRNNPDGMVYDPSQPDLRSQYSPQALMDSALSWFGDAMVKGDRKAANAALSYMSDLMLAFGGDKGAVYRETLGDEDEDEVDPRVALYDEDGNEIEDESPFYEDSYADPNARMPWEDEFPFERGLGNRLFEVYPPLAPLPELANGRWTDAYRARVAARNKAVSARAAARRAARSAVAVRRQYDRLVKADTKAVNKAASAAKSAALKAYKAAIKAAKKYPDETDRARAVSYAQTDFEQAVRAADEEAAVLMQGQRNRIMEGHSETNDRSLARKAWLAEKARIDAQYAYDKLAAEQDGTELPAAPEYPAVFSGYDFSLGVTPDMFDSEEEFQAALAQWNAEQGGGDGVAAPAATAPAAVPAAEEEAAAVPSGAPAAPAASVPASVPSPSDGVRLGGSGEPRIGDDAPEAAEPSPQPPASASNVDEDEEEKKKTAVANRLPRAAALSVLAAVEGAKRDARAGRERRTDALGNTGWTDAARAASLAARRAKYGSGWGASKGWSDAARAASLAVRRAKAAARQGSPGSARDVDVDTASGRELIAAGFEAKPVPGQKPLGYLPLSRYDELIKHAEEKGDVALVRWLQRTRNNARKAWDKVELARKRNEAKAQGSRVYDAMKAAKGMGDGASGVYERAKAESGARIAADGLSSLDGNSSVYSGAVEAFADTAKKRRLPAALAAEYMGGTPVAGAVYYDGSGVLYDSGGNVVGHAPRAPREGLVFYRGRWFDVKTGRAVRSGAEA